MISTLFLCEEFTEYAITAAVTQKDLYIRQFVLLSIASVQRKLSRGISKSLNLIYLLLGYMEALKIKFP